MPASRGLVQESLFGGRDSQRALRRDTPPPAEIPREQLDRLRRPCPVLSVEERRERERRAAEEAAQWMLDQIQKRAESQTARGLSKVCGSVGARACASAFCDAATYHSSSSLSLCQADRDEEGPMAARRRLERDQVRQRAARCALEDLPEARLMTHMAHAARTMAELDRQVAAARQAAEDEARHQVAADQAIRARWQEEQERELVRGRLGCESTRR